MACKNQRAIRCRLQIMHESTRTTRCEHWKHAGGDVWAHQQCFLRWNGDNQHFIWRHVHASMQAARTPASKLRYATPDKESSMNTMWQEEEFKQICSRESLTEDWAEIAKIIFVKEHERERYDFDPTMFYENRFWNQRPDAIVINKNYRTLYIL